MPEIRSREDQLMIDRRTGNPCSADDREFSSAIARRPH